MIQHETPNFKGYTLSVGVIIRLGRRAQRHFKANPIASISWKFTSAFSACQLESVKSTASATITVTPKRRNIVPRLTFEQRLLYLILSMVQLSG